MQPARCTWTILPPAPLHIGRHVEAVIGGADIDIVDVEQEAAAGLFRQTSAKTPIPEYRKHEIRDRCSGFPDQRTAEIILHRAHAVGDMREALPRQRHRQQIMRVHAVDAGPAQMIRNPDRPHMLGELAQLAQIGHVERIGAADRQRHAVHHHRPMRRYAIQHVRGIAVIVDEILADDLEPIDTPLRGIGAHEVRKVRIAQADAVAEGRQSETRFAATHETRSTPSRGAARRSPTASRRRRKGQADGARRRRVRRRLLAAMRHDREIGTIRHVMDKLALR